MATYVNVRVNGGISVISAFAEGHGASIGIELPMDIEMSYGKSGNVPEITNFFKERYSLEKGFYINVRSSIPQGMGLKSSSALVIGITAGINKITEYFNNTGDLLKEGSKVSRELKLSRTGAMDDLACCLMGGLCYADNRNEVFIERWEPEPVNVLILPGSGKRSSYEISGQDLSPYADRYQDMCRRLNEKEFFRIMVENGDIMSEVTGIDRKKLKLLKETGPLAASQSGKGEAMFAIYESREKAIRAKEIMEKMNYAAILTRTSNLPLNVEVK